MDNRYWDRINAIYHRQEAKGLKKYGMPLEANPAAIQTRLTYLEEELVDGLMYIEWIKDNIRLEEQFQCTGGWKVSDPKTRPFKFSNEMEDWEYHG